MADVHDKKTRSFNMSRIRGKDTQPEILVRKFLFGKGFRYKLHDKMLPGKPDLVFPKHKTVIFINGCFWHGHRNCKIFRMPKTKKRYWIPKIEKNMDNDLKNMRLLRKLKWKVVVIWECQLKKAKLERTLNLIINKILN